MRNTTESRARIAIAALLAVALATSACGDSVAESPSPTASFIPSGTIDWQSCPVTTPSLAVTQNSSAPRSPCHVTT